MKYTLKKVEDYETMPQSQKTESADTKSMLFFPDEYVVLDIETTGLNPRFNEIIELSAIKVKNGSVVDEFSTLVKPNGEINSFITNLTGIKKEMTETAPDIEEAILDFYNFCKDYILIGHNISFDLGFIKTNLKKHHNLELTNECIDSLRYARIILPNLPNKKLGTIAAHFNLNTQGMHRGLKDCIVTNLCFCRFKEISQAKQTKLF